MPKIRREGRKCQGKEVEKYLGIYKEFPRSECFGWQFRVISIDCDPFLSFPCSQTNLKKFKQKPGRSFIYGTLWWRIL